MTDMTTGSPARLLLRFSLPMLIGNIFQQFYSMVDAMIVGRFVGVGALASVGATGGMSFLVLGFVIGLSTGFCVVVAQRFGARDADGLRKSVAMSLLLGLVFTVGMTLLSVLSARPLLHLMGTPADIFEDSAAYITVIFAGLGTSLFYNLFSGLLRAVGDSKTPLYFLCLSSILNVGLDLLFVVSLSMGVAGAAWATVLSQGVSALLCLLYLLKKFPMLRTRRTDWRPDAPMLRQLVRMGVPTALSSSVTAIGCMILQGTINSFGSTIVAAYTAATKADQLASQPMFTFGMATATFTAQNAGAQRMDRVRSGVRQALWLAVGASVLGAIVIWLAGGTVTTWFVDPSETEIIAAARLYLNIEAFFFPALGILFVTRNALQGLGNATVPMLSGVVELVMRLLAASLLSLMVGYVGVCLASPIAWVGAVVLLVPAYLAQLRRKAGGQLPPLTRAANAPPESVPAGQ